MSGLILYLLRFFELKSKYIIFSLVYFFANLIRVLFTSPPTSLSDGNFFRKNNKASPLAVPISKKINFFFFNFFGNYF